MLFRILVSGIVIACVTQANMDKVFKNQINIILENNLFSL